MAVEEIAHDKPNKHRQHGPWTLNTILVHISQAAVVGTAILGLRARSA